jgi:uncharacterized membrane protein YgdD (TMEM256/DUF423 family)
MPSWHGMARFPLTFSTRLQCQAPAKPAVQLAPAAWNMGTEEKPHRDHKKWVGTGWDYQMYHIFLFYQRGMLLFKQWWNILKYIISLGRFLHPGTGDVFCFNHESPTPCRLMVISPLLGIHKPIIGWALWDGWPSHGCGPHHQQGSNGMPAWSQPHGLWGATARLPEIWWSGCCGQRWGLVAFH